MTDLVPVAPAPLDLATAAWLHAKAGRSGSARTRRAYQDTLAAFRRAAHAQGLDLDSDARALALVVQAWAADGTTERATINQRLAIVSSFYTFAIKRGLLGGLNPADLVDREKVEAYAGAFPLDYAEVDRRLKAIDRTTLVGLRDYALLALILMTARRLSEIAGVRWGHLAIRGPQITIHWAHMKGDAQMRETLTPRAGKPLLTWLHRYYGARIGDLPADAPVWVSLARNTRAERSLSPSAIHQLCQAHLGTSKVHALRHTVAVAMLDAGASLTEIQQQLGHKNAATTGIYLKRLKGQANPKAAALADLFGLDDD